MNTKIETAANLFDKGFNCAQAVLESHSADYGLDPVFSRKVAGAFGGGMGHCGEVCGAVSGALMLIGLRYGQYKDGDKGAKETTYKITKAFMKKFKEEFGSAKCTELLKYDLSIEEELKKAREAGVFDAICPNLVKRAVELVEEVL